MPSRTPQSPAQQARSTLGAAVRRGDPPERIDQARRDLAEANLAAHIRKVVDTAPPLTPEQRSQLALLLDPGRADGAA